MNDNDDFTGFDFGDSVRILGSQVRGFVTGFHHNVHRGVSYDVEYIDAVGNPQERVWAEDQLSLTGDDADALRHFAEPEELADNVVQLRRAN